MLVLDRERMFSLLFSLLCPPALPGLRVLAIRRRLDPSPRLVFFRVAEKPACTSGGLVIMLVPRTGDSGWLDLRLLLDRFRRNACTADPASSLGVDDPGLVMLRGGVLLTLVGAVTTLPLLLPAAVLTPSVRAVV